MKNNQKNLKELCHFSEKIAFEAGRKLNSFQKKLNDLKIKVKKAQGVVSTADLESEKYIIKALGQRFPEAKILAEEMSYNEAQSWKKKKDCFPKWMWVVDPLDGTNNYLNGLDYFAVCISLLYFGEPVVGVVHRPRTGETFSAYKNGGMRYKIGKARARKIFSSKNHKKLKESLLVTGFVTEKEDFFQREFESFKKMMVHSRGIRRMGSAALDISYVALGLFDGFWERGLAPWDTAAASLIASESGVKVTDYKTQSFCPFNSTIVAARDPLLSKIVKHLKA